MRILRALALLAALLPAVAVAQTTPYPNLPPSTVLGRSAASAGPAQAITFTNLYQTLFGSTITPNYVFAGPSSSPAAGAGFRALVGADLPAPGASSLGGVNSLTCSTSNWFNTLSTGGTFGCSQPQFSDISGTATAAQLPTATASAKGVVQTDGSTISNSAGTISCTTGTSSQLGCLKPDGTTITSSAGVLTAVGSSATSVTASNASGATTIVSGHPGYALTQGASSNYLANNQLFSTAGGHLNKFRNGMFDVYQRGTNITIGTSGNYGLDGWKVYFTGSTSVSVNHGLAAGGSVNNSGALSYMQVVGASGNTDIKVGQRIESYVAAPLAGNTVTVQIQFYQTTGSPVTPKVSTCYASAQDNFATCTADLAATSLTACPSAGWCTESYTFTASGNAINGYEVDFDCNAGFTAAQGCAFTAADIRVTPNVTTGANSNPPAPELRPIWTELAFCQRYFATSYANGTAQGTATHLGMLSTGSAGNASINYANASSAFPVQMRAAPSVSYWDGAGNASKVSSLNGGTPGTSFTDNVAIQTAPFNISTTGFLWYGNSSNGIWYFLHYSASAEL